MHLIYINEIGKDYKGQKQYEFIFSTLSEIDMENWFDIPATSTFESKTPDTAYISGVGLLKDTDLDLELIQNSDYFGVIDAVYGIIAMGWEKYDTDLDVDRIYFKFGESYDNVLKKLKKRDYTLKMETIKSEND